MCLFRFLSSAAKAGKNQGTLTHLLNCQSLITWILISWEAVAFPRWACQACWQGDLCLIELRGVSDVCFVTHCVLRRRWWYSFMCWPNSLCMSYYLSIFFLIKTWEQYVYPSKRWLCIKNLKHEISDGDSHKWFDTWAIILIWSLSLQCRFTRLWYGGNDHPSWH